MIHINRIEFVQDYDNIKDGQRINTNNDVVILVGDDANVNLSILNAIHNPTNILMFVTILGKQHTSRYITTNENIPRKNSLTINSNINSIDKFYDAVVLIDEISLKLNMGDINSLINKIKNGIEKRKLQFIIATNNSKLIKEF